MSLDGIFGTEVVRLMRDDWPNAQMLAQELFAIFTSTQPITNPIASAIPAGSTAPVYDVGGYSNGNTLFNLTGKSGQPYGTISIQDGNLVFTQSPTNDAPIAPTQEQLAGNTGGGGVIPGFIASGSGSTYMVNIFPNGLNKASQTVQVTQLKILATETIPAGEAVLVSKSPDGTYFMQYPTWGQSS